MADEEKKKEESKSEEEFAFPSDDFKTDGGGDEGGLGNLPPLSDFESDESSRSDEGGLGGLPPLSDLEESDPQPTGGRIKPQESSGAPPTPAGPSPGSGFQGIGADSDFSPETPEIGPGPDSDIATPMFDSAFGGQDTSGFNTPVGGQGGGGGVPPTGAPTQAMETPMFGDSPSGGGLGFDDDAFGLGGGGGKGGSGGGGFGGDDFGGGRGTPAPSFGPDTQAAPPPPPGMAAPPEKSGVSPLVAVIVLLVGAVVGLVGGQFFSIHGFPDVQQSRIQEQQTEIQMLQNRLQAAIQDPIGGGETQLTPEEIDRLIDEKDRLSAEITALQQQQATAEQGAIGAEERLRLVQADLDQTTAEYAETRSEYERLLDEVSIISARQEGLIAETERLTGLVGQLEEADQRRIASKEALQHGIERLSITVREGIPLTPERFARNARMDRVAALGSQVSGSNWVAPDMVREFTSLFLEELEIAQSREYFFARIPVETRFGGREVKWAECVMNGNWSVYYRTLDGRQIGLYENVGTPDSPEFAFVQFLPSALEKSIEAQIVNARTPGWEDKVRLLADKEQALTTESEWQRWFSSL